MIIAAVGLMVVVVGVVLIVGLGVGPFGGDTGTDDDDVAVQEADGLPADGPADSAPDDAGGDDPAGDDPADAPAADDEELAEPVVPLSNLDIDAADLLIDLGSAVEPVTLRGGTGVLADGRTIRRVPQLTAQGDVTGDGRDELVLAMIVEGPTGEGDDQPALAVLTDDVDRGAIALVPPVLTMPDRSGPWAPATVGMVEALGIHQGGIEVAIIAANPGEDTLTLADDRADPWVENWRAEVRFDSSEGTWIASADGPVTRVARDIAADAGIEVEDVLCEGRAYPRGANVTCAGFTTDGFSTRTEIVLLAVDDTGAVRAVVGQPAPVASATEVRRLLGPGEHFCRDIDAQAAADDLAWALPMAAVSYWFDDGMPARMDASQNGIPCQTVFDDVAAFLTGSDAVVRAYDAALAP